MRNAFGWSIVVASMAASPGSAAAGPLSSTGTISIVTDSTDVAELLPGFIDAMDGAFSARGFTILQTPGHAVLLARVHVTQTDLGAARARILRDRKPTVAAGGVAGVGGGLGVSLGSGASRDVSLKQTRLDIRISKRGDDQILWHASAITVRPDDTPGGEGGAVARDLTDAALRDFPNQSGQVVSVP